MQTLTYPQPVLFMPTTIIKENGLQTYILQNGWGICEVSYCKAFGFQKNLYPKRTDKSTAQSMYGRRITHIEKEPHCYTAFSENGSTMIPALDYLIQSSLNELENLLTLSKC